MNTDITPENMKTLTDKQSFGRYLPVLMGALTKKGPLKAREELLLKFVESAFQAGVTTGYKMGAAVFGGDND